MHLSQLDPTQPLERTRVREALEKYTLFLELSVPASALEEPEAFARAAAVARELGTTLLRVALLSGRRYESFRRMEDRRALGESRPPAPAQAGARLGKEGRPARGDNHKGVSAAGEARTLR